MSAVNDLLISEVPEELDSRGYATGVEAEDEDATLGIHEPFDPEKIDVITRTPTVDLMLSRIRDNRMDLQPDFQRHAGIWTPRAKSRLIESLLLRIPLPTFYAAEGDDDLWAMVDGIQRLTTIAEFIEPNSVGSSPMRLRQLEYLGRQCDGMVFDELPGRLQTRLRETELVVHLIRRGTPEEVMFNIFARLNTGGLPLSRQELRHALIPGRGRTILKEWAESVYFREATQDSVRSERMADREMILRFIAFYRSEPQSYSDDDFDRFLRDSMHQLNQLKNIEIDHLRERFNIAMLAAGEIFGIHAFRKRDPAGGGRRFPINKALFEAVSVNLANSPQQIPKLVKRKEQVNQEMVRLMRDTDFQSSISQGTGDVAKVRRRFATLSNLFKGIAK